MQSVCRAGRNLCNGSGVNAMFKKKGHAQHAPRDRWTFLSVNLSALVPQAQRVLVVGSIESGRKGRYGSQLSDIVQGTDTENKSLLSSAGFTQTDA